MLFCHADYNLKASNIINRPPKTDTKIDHTYPKIDTKWNPQISKVLTHSYPKECMPYLYSHDKKFPS